MSGDFYSGPGRAGGAWVAQAAPACVVSGLCQLQQAQEMVASTRTIVAAAERIKETMLEGVALWCDLGGHAFSSRDPGRQVMKVQTFGEQGEETGEEQRQACGRCAEKAGLVRKAVTNTRRVIMNGDAIEDEH